MKKTGKYIIGLFLLIISAVILANSLIAAEIHDAVNNGDFDKVKELINNDPGIIDSRTIDSSTPLHLAVMKQNHEIVTFLIEKGSDINTKDVYGRTPADKAQIMNDDRMAGLLRQHDAVESGLLSRDLRGGYLGQKLPGDEPELFAPGIVSTGEANEMDPAFYPDMSEFYFVKGYTYQIIRRNENSWGEPETASFSGKFPDFEAFITHDGGRLYFISRRPPENWESYYVERTGPASWGEAKLLGEKFKGGFYPTLTEKGNVYVTAFWQNGRPFHLYYSRDMGENGYSELEKLPEEINENGAFESCISPDESFIIFGKADQPDGYGGNDLYISFRDEDGSWSKAKNLGEGINTEHHDSRPVMSHDGRFFFFSSNKYGTNDIFWVDTKIFNQFKK